MRYNRLAREASSAKRHKYPTELTGDKPAHAVTPSDEGATIESGSSASVGEDDEALSVQVSVVGTDTSAGGLDAGSMANLPAPSSPLPTGAASSEAARLPAMPLEKSDSAAQTRCSRFAGLFFGRRAPAPAAVELREFSMSAPVAARDADPAGRTRKPGM